MMTPQQNNNDVMSTNWDAEDAETLQKILSDPEPISEGYVKYDDKEQSSSSSASAKTKVPPGKQKPKTEKKSEQQTTIKKPRSPYNLFFQIERELIMSNLDCSPKASSLSVNKSNTEDDQGGSLALEDALPGIPMPARYNGANILNPLIVINNERRKHRKVHGKIGFIELSRMIADRWKTSGKDVKDYFKALSEKDYQRYKLESAKKNKIVSSSTINSEKVAAQYIASGTQMESSSEIVDNLMNKKRALVQGENQAHSRVKRRHSMGSTPSQVQSFTAQNVTMQQPQSARPMKFSRRQSLPSSFGTYPPPGNNIPVRRPSLCFESEGFVGVAGSEFEPRRLTYRADQSEPLTGGSDFQNFNSGNIGGQLEGEVNDEIKLFLSQLVREEK